MCVIGYYRPFFFTGVGLLIISDDFGRVRIVVVGRADDLFLKAYSGPLTPGGRK
jgi:hypothetical protein